MLMEETGGTVSRVVEKNAVVMRVDGRMLLCSIMGIEED